MEFPRLLYRGPADATAETMPVADGEALVRAQAQGWRLRRVDAPPAESVSETSETSETPDPEADPDPEDPAPRTTLRDAVAGRLKRGKR